MSDPAPSIGGGEALRTRSGTEGVDAFNAKLLVEEASLPRANVLALANTFCIKRLPVGDFAGSGGGGGVDVDVLGLVEAWLGMGKSFSAVFLVLFALALDRDNSPFRRWFAVSVFERVGVGTSMGVGTFARGICSSETTVSSIPIGATTFLSPESSLCRNLASASNLQKQAGFINSTPKFLGVGK